jgi:hypothetical protein
VTEPDVGTSGLAAADGDGLEFEEDGLDPGQRDALADKVAAEVSPDANTDQSGP